MQTGFRKMPSLASAFQSLKLGADTILLSYSQVLFSSQKWFGLLICFVTFLQPITGLFGLVALLLALVLGKWWNLNSGSLNDGVYLYNSLLIGLGIGSLYQYSNWLWVLLVIGTALCLLLTVALNQWLASKYVPVFSLPFIFSLWIIMMTGPVFGKFAGAIMESEYKLEIINIVSKFFSQNLEQVSGGEWIKVFFKSLSALFFIYDPFAGFLLFIGLLFSSRINAFLAVFGFVVALGFMAITGSSFALLANGYLGFNFILFAIAFGGFFIYPTTTSFFNLMLLLSMVALLTFGFNYFFNVRLGLPVYSMPFSIAGILTLLMLQSRIVPKNIHLIPYPGGTPEIQTYHWVNDTARLKDKKNVSIYLPVIGEWRVPQAHNGTHTHKEHWRFAFDFDLITENGFTYYSPGASLFDFVCYGMPVIAPAAGYVVEVQNYIADNEIKGVNLQNNWGNTVVIKHAEGLYSKLSHLQNQSLKVAVGDYVFAGTLIGNCGNSGRSPEPHLHFQMQTVPIIGAYTLQYPFAYYFKKLENDTWEFHQNDYPREGDIVKNILPEDFLVKTFTFLPGQVINFEVKTMEGLPVKKANFEVGVSAWNKSFLYEAASKSYLYFNNDGVTFECYDFVGKKNSFLFQFYSSLQKLLLCSEANVAVKEYMMPTLVFNKWALSIQDLLLPFFTFFKGEYTSELNWLNQAHSPTEAIYHSKVHRIIAGKSKLLRQAEIVISNNQISTLKISAKQKIVSWKRVFV